MCRNNWQALQPRPERPGSGYLTAHASSTVYLAFDEPSEGNHLLTEPRILRVMHARESGEQKPTTHAPQIERLRV